MTHVRPSSPGRHTVVIAWTFAVLVLTAGIVRAQGVLTLDSCISLAKERNLQLRVSAAAAASADLLLGEFQAATKPQVRLKSDAIVAPLTPSLGYDPVVSNQGELSAQVVVEQTLYDGGVRGLRSDRLTMETQRAALQHRATERDLVFAVQTAFVEALRSSREVALQQESLDQLAEYLTIAERMAHGGAGSSTDVLKTRVQLADAAIALQSAIATAADSRLALAELIGIPVDTAFSVQGSLDTLIGVPADTAANAEVQDPSQNLDMRIAAMEVQQSLLDAETARRELYPTIGLFGDAGFLTSVENLRLPSGERSTIAGYEVGVSVELPVFTWGATDLRAQEREIAVDTLRFQSMLLRRSLEHDVRRTLIRLAAAGDHLRSLRSSLTAAEDNFLLTKSKYVGGGSLALEVLTAQQLLTDRKLSELQTLAEIQDLKAEIQRLSSH